MDVTGGPLGDEVGPREAVLLRDPRVGLEAIVVVDNIACGPAIGGVRMAPDVTREEVGRLARAMNFKNAAAGLAHGGGKVESSPTHHARPHARRPLSAHSRG
jgi:glutamate dehydrogenase (NAD(P)+)